MPLSESAAYHNKSPEREAPGRRVPTKDNLRLCPGTKPAGLTGLLPGCFSHEPGATRAGPGARFSSTREAPGRAGLSKKKRPARFFRAGFPGAPGPVPAPVYSNP